ADRTAKFSGQTALQMTKDQADMARNDGDAEAERKCRAAMAVLTDKKAAAAAQPADGADASRAVAAFAANAKKPAYRRVRQLLAERCGEGRPWQPAPDHGIAATDVYCFTLKKATQKALKGLQAEVAKAGYHLVLTEAWAPGDDAELVLFPTSD